MRLLRWNNWFYAGSASFLQSSVQEINLQTTLGGGIGRYLKNTNRVSLYRARGVWAGRMLATGKMRFLRYTEHRRWLRYHRNQSLQIQEDKPRSLSLSHSGNLRFWTCPFQRQCNLLSQGHRRSLLEFFVLRKLGQSASRNTTQERLRHQLRT
jgi:hypothetical protein